MMTPDPRANVPEKYFAKWLRTESRLAELEIWIGFAKYVLALGTIAGVTIFLGNRPPETLSYLLKVFGAAGSLVTLVGGVVVAVRTYKRNRHDDA